MAANGRKGSALGFSESLATSILTTASRLLLGSAPILLLEILGTDSVSLQFLSVCTCPSLRPENCDSIGGGDHSDILFRLVFCVVGSDPSRKYACLGPRYGGFMKRSFSSPIVQRSCMYFSAHTGAYEHENKLRYPSFSASDNSGLGQDTGNSVWPRMRRLSGASGG